MKDKKVIIGFMLFAVLVISIILIKSLSNKEGEIDLSKLTNLTTIDDFAFDDNQITSVKLPISITLIGSGVLVNNSLTTIINPSGNSFDWELAISSRTNGLCIFATGTCGDITISAS